MKHLLLILFLLASTGYSDSKTDTTIVPKKAGGSVIISGGTGQILMKGSTVNVRSSEGAGTTTLTISDNRTQVFTLTAARTVVLPSLGIVSGEAFTIVNKSAYKLSIQSSALNDVDNITSGRVVVIATQNTPTSASHWITIEASSGWVDNSSDWTPSSAAFGSITNKKIAFCRVGSLMHVKGTWKNGTISSNDADVGYLQLPSGYTIYTTNLTSSLALLGQGRSNSSASTAQGVIDFFWDGSDNTKLFTTYYAVSYAYEKKRPGYYSNSGDGMAFELWVPITEWAMF